MRHPLLLCLLPVAAAFAPSASASARPRLVHPHWIRAERAYMSVDVLSAVDNFYRSSPYLSAFLTCGLKAATSDSITQRFEKSPFCVTRNAAFTLYGGLYQGVVQYIIFNKIFPLVFGSGTDLATVAAKVLTDQFILTPFLCLPAAYLIKAIVFRKTLKYGLQRYVADAKRDLLWKYWAIWGPTQCLTFSVVPEHLRIAFIAFVSFFWLLILSSISSRSNAAEGGIECVDTECIIAEQTPPEPPVAGGWEGGSQDSREKLP